MATNPGVSGCCQAPRLAFTMPRGQSSEVPEIRQTKALAHPPEQQHNERDDHGREDGDQGRHRDLTKPSPSEIPLQQAAPLAYTARWTLQGVSEASRSPCLHTQRREEQRDEEVTDVLDLSVEPWLPNSVQAAAAANLGLRREVQLARLSFVPLAARVVLTVHGQHALISRKTRKLAAGSRGALHCMGMLPKQLLVTKLDKCKPDMSDMLQARPAMRAASSIETPTCINQKLLLCMLVGLWVSSHRCCQLV